MPKSLYRSFSGGQISEELYGRLDLVKNQTGLALAQNIEIMAHGPARNRAGFQYVLEVRNSVNQAAMIPFSFSTTQTMALEFGDQYIRFHTNAGTLLENSINITAITQANPAALTIPAHGYNSGNTVFVTNITGMTQLNARFFTVVVIDPNTISLQDFSGAAINSLAYGAYVSGGSTARIYEIVSPYAAADVLGIHYEQSADVLTLVHPSYQQRELRRLGAVSWTLSTLAFAPTIGTPIAPTVATGGAGGGTAINNIYVVTAIAKDGLEEGLASPSTTQSYDLTVAGNFIDVNPNPGGAVVTNAIRYNIYKTRNGVQGYIGQTDGSVLRDNNITPDVTKVPLLVNDPFVGAGNWPRAVGYSDQRRIFGGTTNKPQNVAATQPATESNMSYRIPTIESDAVFFRMATRDSQTIRHIVAFTDLVILTDNGLWRIAADVNNPISPSNINPKLQTSVGANNVRPMVIGRNLVYCENAGSRVREAAYQWQLQGYDSSDVSLMVPSLFDNFTIVSAAYTRVPMPIAWFVRSDGALLGCTYMPEQDVRAWHIHYPSGTGAAFESVCSVRENGIDVLYAIVRRIINGRTVRYVEAKHTRLFTNPADAFFVDSGLTYDSVPASTISGLWHLEGQTVNVMADGATHPQLVVSGGTVTLQGPASKVQIGIPMVARIMTLPLGLEGEALGQGLQKNVGKAYLRFVLTSGVTAGPSFDKMRPVKQRTTEPYGTAAALLSTEVPHELTPSWNVNGATCIEQTEPQPFMLSSMTLDVAVGG